MLKAPAAVSATCAGMPGHCSPNISPAQTMIQEHFTDF
jgi:hypothetical protein